MLPIQSNTKHFKILNYCGCNENCCFVTKLYTEQQLHCTLQSMRPLGIIWRLRIAWTIICLTEITAWLLVYLTFSFSEFRCNFYTYHTSLYSNSYLFCVHISYYTTILTSQRTQFTSITNTSKINRSVQESFQQWQILFKPGSLLIMKN